MSDVLKFGKKVFTSSVVGATMLWSVGVSALLPAVANAAVCPAMSSGDMVKVSGKPAIYSVNNSMKILYFPSGDEFKSWTSLSATAPNQYASQGYLTITQDCFDSLSVPSTYPGGVNFRPGSYVVKRPSSDQLYVVLPGNSLAKISSTDAKALYGTNYKVMTVADAFWPHYVNRGADVAGTVHEGMLVSNDGKTWYVDAGMKLREVTAAGMTANRFKAGWVHAVPASYLAGTSVGAMLDSMESTLTNRTQDGAVTPGPAPVGGNLTVSLAADNPAAANLADGSAYNSVLKLNLRAGSAATNVTGITLTKTGLIANTNITGVSVWDAQGNRHGDVMSSLTSDNKVTVSFGSYPIMVAAGGSESLLVAVNIATTANSGLVGFNVNAATDIMSNGTAGGSFPIVGNQMSIIDGNASLGAFTVTGQSVGGSANQPASTAAGNLNIGDLQKEVAKFRFTETSGNEDLTVSRLTFYAAGTIQDSDLANISVYGPDGALLGNGGSLSNRYVTVKFATSYVVPKSTNRDLSVKVDVINGSTRNFNIHLQSDYDMLVKGNTTGFFILPTSFTDTTSTSAWFNMGSGTLTVNKTPSSPAGNISSGASNVVLARFDVKATGENMELRKMGLGINRGNGSVLALTGNVTVRDASDGTVYLTVAASTADLYTPAAAQRNLSSYINLTANQTKTLEVIGSVNTTATSGNSYIVGVGNFYAKRASTLDFADNLPNSTNTSTAANQLTVSATSLTCNRDTAMGSVTRAAGTTSVIAQYICTAGTSEDVRLSNTNINFGPVSGGTAASTFQNMSLWNGSTQLGTTISTVASSSNSYSFDLTVPKNGTVMLQVKALIVSGATAVVTTSFGSYNFNGKDSGTAGTGNPVAGQQVTVGSGNLYITAVSDATTIGKIYGPSQASVQLGKWKFTATNDDITLKKLTLTSRNAHVTGGDQTALGTFGTLSLYDGSTKLADASYVTGDVVFTGFSASIPMDSYKVFTLKGGTTASGVISSNTTTVFVVKSDSNTDMEAMSSAGSLLGTADISATSSTSNSLAETRFATSTQYFFHDAYPTMVATSLGSSLGLDTTAQILKFTITNSGTRDLRFGSSTIAVSVSGLQGNSGPTASSGTIRGFRLYEEGAPGTLGTRLAGGTANDSADVVIASSTASPSNVTFDPTNDVNSLLDNFVISPGSSRTLIVTADTSNMGTTKTAGTSVTVSAKISGSTGWSGTAWNTGNLFYYYTAVGGTENTVPFTHSDSYDVQGSTMSRSF
ncbi:MAG: hypothetical protein G01um101413_94 [Parcubacteria group bacterium Gr01-1014_13]|nr:MAG: hypothetical protein G01um101413_94 [Parcubacteria group bacterium Gr01-1014_13]